MQSDCMLLRHNSNNIKNILFSEFLSGSNSDKPLPPLIAGVEAINFRVTDALDRIPTLNYCHFIRGNINI